MELDSYACENCILQKVCLPFVSKMQFCAELLKLNWYMSSQGEMPSKSSNTTNETTSCPGSTGNPDPNVLINMKMSQWMNL
jgi:hypothetical protein